MSTISAKTFLKNQGAWTVKKIRERQEEIAYGVFAVRSPCIFHSRKWEITDSRATGISSESDTRHNTPLPSSVQLT